MTALFEDVHDKLNICNLAEHRLPATRYDEILFADDTICISQDNKTMNKLLKTIEEESEKYGMALNYAKCEMLHFGQKRAIHFKDGKGVKQKQELST